jgi:hypothetical protein
MTDPADAQTREQALGAGVGFPTKRSVARIMRKVGMRRFAKIAEATGVGVANFIIHAHVDER